VRSLDLYELMTKRLARVAGIQRTSTLGIVRIVKRAYAYPVPAIEPAGASGSLAATRGRRRRRAAASSRPARSRPPRIAAKPSGAA
jgi:hypothetical protein